jgi:CO/xanthine dehydrogenase Mo-binding subunit
MSGPGAWPPRTPERVEQRIVIEPDGTVVARSGKVEYGQGVRTGFARIVAEELDVPVERVRVELGETDRVPWDMGTFGSLSTATDGKSLRMAAAQARHLLIDRATARLGLPVSELDTKDGQVVSIRNGRAVSYQDLVAGEPLSGPVPAAIAGGRAAAPIQDVPLRLEARDIVTGHARYPADVRLPGMLRGHLLHPPVPGARLLSVDERAARGLPGVVAIVHDEDTVGAVAQRDEQALSAIQALQANWGPPEVAGVPPTELVLRRDAGVGAALAASLHSLHAEYHVPPIAHASIGPSAAVADVRDDGADLYVATQRPFGLRDEAAELLGLPPERVRVHPQAMSGIYGRGNVNDAALDAVRLSRAARRPVLVQWTRTEEFRLSPHRPVLDATIEAALDPTGAIAAWRYQARTNPHTYSGGLESRQLIEITCGRNAVPPYRLGCAEVSLQVVPSGSRTGAFRSLAAAPHVFAIESFVDELAHAAREDPLAFRLRLIDDHRLGRVLERVRERSRWNDRPRDAGRGFGVACAVYHGTAVAQVAEVVVAPSGRVGLERVWCAVDPGRLVHPDGARNQIEGGIQQAASWTLLEELRIGDDKVVTATWHDYPIATFADAPREIDVVFTAEPGADSTGVGEPGSVPTAAAIANAVFAASGARVRRVPLTQAAVAVAGNRGP